MSSIRLATLEDAARICEIYAPFTREDCPISFETACPSPEEMRHRIEQTSSTLPWICYSNDDRVLAYAYAGTHKQRAAYRWSVDVSIYVDPSAHRLGIGKTLYQTLFSILRLQGFVNAYAGITLPNPGSVGLHTALGFKQVGVYQKVGFKGGAWHDVAWLELQLKERNIPPEEPKTLPDIRDTEEFANAFDPLAGVSSSR